MPVSQSYVFEQANSGEARNVLGDWILRIGIGVAFVFIGWEKFPNGTEWVGLFQQIGLGQWFRYFTGAVEILGGILVSVPSTANAALAPLASTMAAAALIHVVILGHPGNCIIPGVFTLGLAAGWWIRRSD
jgi:putative oxidoreductase